MMVRRFSAWDTAAGVAGLEDATGVAGAGGVAATGAGAGGGSAGFAGAAGALEGSIMTLMMFSETPFFCSLTRSSGLSVMGLLPLCRVLTIRLSDIPDLTS